MEFAAMWWIWTLIIVACVVALVYISARKTQLMRQAIAANDNDKFDTLMNYGNVAAIITVIIGGLAAALLFISVMIMIFDAIGKLVAG